MKRQKRFESKSQIVNLIDSKKRQAAELLELSCSNDRQVQLLLDQIASLSNRTNSKEIQLEITQLQAQINKLRTETLKFNVTRHRIEEHTLPALKRTLAAFNTMPLPIFTDEAVVMQT